LPPGRQPDGPPGTLEKLLFQLALELLDRHRHGRLRPADLLGGPAEASFPGDSEKSARLVNFHRQKQYQGL